MQLIGQSDMVVRALLVFLSIMLFASVYLFLIKVINLSCRAYHARRFLRGLGQARSWQQLQELVDRQTTIGSFSRLAHHILIQKKTLDATTGQYGPAGVAHGVMAQRLIEHEAAAQATDLHQGLKVLAAMVWAAPLTGLAATVWHGVWIWQRSIPAGWQGSSLWADGLAMMQLGLFVAAIALAAYVCLLAGTRMYLSQFVLFRQTVVSLLEQGVNAKAHNAKSRHGFPHVQQSA
ncbi:hypothetical protein D7I39_18760 [Allopusillimonas ginsengisoli]|nr:hypothetical protein D7I39_18760 [Allopusillimonas ginsengisoli]